MGHFVISIIKGWMNLIQRELIVSNDEDDGSENVAKKNEFASLKTLSRLFESAQFIKYTNVGDFSWS